MLLGWRSVRACPSPTVHPHTRIPTLLGRLVCLTLPVIGHRHAPNHASRDEMVSVWIAAAPRCWPARLVAAAVRSRSEAPPQLARLVDAVRLLTGGTVATVALATMLLTGGTLAVALVSAAAVGAMAARLPLLVLRRAARRAIHDAEPDIPTSVELLAGAVAAGLPLDRALATAASHAPPPIAAAFRAAALRRAAGDDPSAAFGAEARRWTLPALADVGRAVARQQRLGAPLHAELWTLAAGLRAECRARALERSARRGPLATLVVATVIAPVCVAALAACVLGGLVQTHGGLGM